MKHLIKIIRFKYTNDTTIGKMYINDVYFGYVLEDTVRAWGIKVKEHTALPANYSGGEICWEDLFEVGISYSNRFKREMSIIFNQENGYEVKAGGISFKGCRCHGGNTHKNTEGCPLIARNYDGNETIQGSLEKEFTAKVKELLETGKVYLLIENQMQAQ